MKMIIVVLLGIIVAAMSPAPLNIMCMTDMECELMFGLEEGED